MSVLTNARLSIPNTRFALFNAKFICSFQSNFDEKIIPDDIHASLLNRDIHKCRWVSLLSQRVYIRINAVDEVDRLVDSNLAYLNSSDNMNGSRTQFYRQSNQAVKYIIRIYKSHRSDLDGDDLLFKGET